MLAEPQWAAIFGAAKRRGARWRDGPDVEAFKREVTDALAMARNAPEKPAERVEPPQIPTRTSLGAPEAFYAAVRRSFGALKQSQVEGFEYLLAAMGAEGWSAAWAAYGLATAWHETARTMQPVRESYWLGEAARKRLRYYPWYGRGYVQLTWEGNYRWADKTLGLDGALLREPDKAMNPAIAAEILVKGMRGGAFSRDKDGKPHSLGRYLPGSPADVAAFREARRIINLMDKADWIAGHAVKFQAALIAGAWR